MEGFDFNSLGKSNTVRNFRNLYRFRTILWEKLDSMKSYELCPTATALCRKEHNFILCICLFPQVFTYVDSLLTVLVPLIAISCMLIGLVLSIVHATRWKKRMGSLPLVMRAPTPPPRYKKSQVPSSTNMTSPENSTTASAPLPYDAVGNGSTHAHTEDTSSISYGCRYHHGNKRSHFGKFHKKGAIVAHSNNDGRSTCSSTAKRCAHRPKNAQVRVTRMLFALSVSYVVMNAPIHVTRLYYLIRAANVLGGSGQDADCQLTYSEGLINLTLQFITYVHSAGKFWIFLLFSKNFTKSLTRLLKETPPLKRFCL